MGLDSDAGRADLQRAIGTALRGLTAGGVLLSADVHLDLWATQGFDQISMIGPLFLVNAVAGFVIAIAVLVWRHWSPVLVAVGFGVVTLAAFWVSVTVGLFGLHETASGASQVLSEVAEIVVIVCGVLALVVNRWGGSGATMSSTVRPWRRTDERRRAETR